MEYLVTTWAAVLMTQAVLSFALILRPRGLPWFTRFIVADFIRWIFLFAVVWRYGFRSTQYGFSFLFTEPISMILLACAGIEAFGRHVRERPPWTAYVTIIVSVLLIGAALPHHNLQSRAAPSIYEIALNKMFMQRALFAFLTVALLLVASAWHERPPDAHGTILFCFCLFDLVTYLSLTIYPAWAKARPLDAPLFVMTGQLGCLVAWAIRFCRRSGSDKAIGGVVRAVERAHET